MKRTPRILALKYGRLLHGAKREAFSWIFATRFCTCFIQLTYHPSGVMMQLVSVYAEKQKGVYDRVDLDLCCSFQTMIRVNTSSRERQNEGGRQSKGRHQDRRCDVAQQLFDKHKRTYFSSRNEYSEERRFGMHMEPGSIDLLFDAT
jgi:hypothetical protein